MSLNGDEVDRILRRGIYRFLSFFHFLSLSFSRFLYRRLSDGLDDKKASRTDLPAGHRGVKIIHTVHPERYPLHGRDYHRKGSLRPGSYVASKSTCLSYSSFSLCVERRA